eukprot:scaffold59956_cov37-Cyclotella_meneghiniana.AAC.1
MFHSPNFARFPSRAHLRQRDTGNILLFTKWRGKAPTPRSNNNTSSESGCTTSPLPRCKSLVTIEPQKSPRWVKLKYATV